MPEQLKVIDVYSEHLPVIPNYVVGYRAWKLTMWSYPDGQERCRLLSLFSMMHNVWTPQRALIAECANTSMNVLVINGNVGQFQSTAFPVNPYHDQQRIPCRHCNCGIYAFRGLWETSENLYDWMQSYLTTWEDNIEFGIGVIGTVALWGHIVHHRYGYRAQYAYPLSINLCWPHPRQTAITTSKVHIWQQHLQDDYKIPVTVMPLQWWFHRAWETDQQHTTSR